MTITVTLRPLKGTDSDFEIEIDESATVCDLKEQISNRPALLFARTLILIYKGKILRDTEHVSEIGLKPNSYVVLLASGRKKVRTLPAEPLVDSAIRKQQTLQELFATVVDFDCEDSLDRLVGRLSTYLVKMTHENSKLADRVEALEASASELQKEVARHKRVAEQADMRAAYARRLQIEAKAALAEMSARCQRSCEDQAELQIQSEMWRHSDLFCPSQVLYLPLRPAVHDTTMIKLMQKLLRILSHTGIGSRCDAMSKASVLRIRPIVNAVLWSKYKESMKRTQHKLQKIGTAITHVSRGNLPMIQQSLPWIQLNHSVNERLVFHGMPIDLVEKVSQQGLDERYAGKGGGSLYGLGLYFAEESCKAFQYCKPGPTGEQCMLMCRVVLGEPYFAASQDSRPSEERRVPPQRTDAPGHANETYDSIIAEKGIPNGRSSGKQEHREFILCAGEQVYPEFAIYFVA